MKQSDLRKFIFIINTLALLLFFQNCTFSKNSSQSFNLESLLSGKTNLSGNGGTYDGKPDGYKRLVPGYTCAGQKTTFASLDIQNQSAILTTSDGGVNCQKSEAIAFADLDFSVFSNRYVGYKEGLYTYLDDIQKSLDQQIFTEAFCQAVEKKSNGEPLFEVAVEWGQTGKKAKQYFYNDKNSQPIISDLNRKIGLDRVLYHGEVYGQLEINFNDKIPQSYKVVGVYRTMANPFLGLSVSCRLGGQFDLAAPQFSYTNTKDQTAVLGQTIQKLIPQINKAAVQFNLDQALPSGLLFDSKTGIISGTPLEMSSRKIYNITALFEFGEVTQAFSLGVGKAVQVDRLHSNLPTEQQCLFGAVECSLEAAIKQANTQAPLPLIANLTMGALTLESELVISGDLEINGVSSQTVLDAQNQSRHFRLEEKAHLSLSHLKLINGFSEQGGAIKAAQADLHLKNVSFENNKSSSDSQAEWALAQKSGQGGAIYLSEGNLIISDSVFINNSTIDSGSSIGGGAIYIDSALSVYISGSEFNHNYSAYGGAIYAVAKENSLYEIKISQFTNNSSLINGGALYLVYGSLKINETIFKQNSSNEAGAIYSNMNTNLWLEKIKFDSNSGTFASVLNIVGSLTNLIDRGVYILDSEFVENTNSVYFPHIKANQILVTEGKVVFKNTVLKSNASVNNCMFQINSLFSKIIDLGGNISDDSSCPF